MSVVVVHPVLVVVARKCPCVGNGEARRHEEHYGYDYRRHHLASQRWECVQVDRGRTWTRRRSTRVYLR